MVEKATYTGPWHVPWKRAKKDPSAPKRPMSAFLYFAQGRRTNLKNEHPDMKNTEISRILGEMWRNATDEDRRPHVEKEKAERAKYKVAAAKWREEYEAKMEAERKAQAEHANSMMMVAGGEHGMPMAAYPPDHYGQHPVPGQPPPPYIYGQYAPYRKLGFCCFDWQPYQRIS